jgi:hypothetical protein
MQSLQWWLTFRRNKTFWSWVRDTYTDQELSTLASEATDTPLYRPWDPWADPSHDPTSESERTLRSLSNALLGRYGTDIWSICLRAGGHDPEHKSTGMSCIATLDYAFQVHDPDTFAEFLVRNALKFGARQLLEEKVH